VQEQSTDNVRYIGTTLLQDPQQRQTRFTLSRRESERDEREGAVIGVPKTDYLWLVILGCTITKHADATA
jgi:hypothetical protein